MSSKKSSRALKYRQLAHLETDEARAAVLHRIADEAERDTLHFADRVDVGFQGDKSVASPVGTSDKIPEHIRTFCERFFSPEGKDSI
jgi:hypothetical protein